MKVKREDTDESRRYWAFLDENSKHVASWPEWKLGARPTTPASGGELGRADVTAGQEEKKK